jgi:phosphatidylglycerol:prolipoprotein diacylglycerol transferase
VILWARWRGFLEARLFDLAAPGLAVGYAIGRVGCQLSGDGDYGEATDLPWGMAYPDATVPTTDDVHPTPVFETVAMGLIALVLWNLRDRFPPGLLFGLYLVLAGLERLLIELIRRNDAVVAGLTQAQLVSLAMIALGAALIMRLRDGPEPKAA